MWLGHEVPWWRPPTERVVSTDVDEASDDEDDLLGEGNFGETFWCGKRPTQEDHAPVELGPGTLVVFRAEPDKSEHERLHFRVNLCEPINGADADPSRAHPCWLVKVRNSYKCFEQ